MMDVSSLVADALTGDLSWESDRSWSVEEMLETASEHGVETLLWEALGATSGPARTVREALDARVRAAATRDLFVQRDMRAVLDALASAGVRALVIKGSALAYSLYAQPWQRPRTDTDLLVSTEDVPAAEAALGSCGYARSDALTTGVLVSHQVAFERTDIHGVHHVVDLHWKIVNPLILADALQFERLWEGRLSAPALGPAACVPSHVASVALCAIHRLAHHQDQNRLIWLYDLRLLTAHFGPEQWAELQLLACDRRVAGLCLDALQQARDRLGSTLPEPVERALAAAAPTEPSHRYLEGTVRKRDVLRSDLAALGSWGDRWRLLREHAFPPAAFIRQRYGVKNPLLLPALYVHRLVTGAYKWVRP